jgi:hypothetical protein
LKTEPARAAEYYTGAEAREERAADFWRGAIRGCHLAAGGTVAELRPDISPALAARLGIANPRLPLTQAGIANLLNATRLDGEAIAGRKKHTATRSVAELFGLDPKQPASAEAIANVPQLHTHVTVLNSVLTDSGHIGAVDLDRLAGRVKELGAVYHANVATRARRLGIETTLEERTGAAATENRHANRHGRRSQAMPVDRGRAGH